MNSISERKLEERYESMLDEVYGEINICGLTYSASQALKSVDPVAFRCGFADYISAELEETLIEVDGEYFDRQEYEAEHEDEDT